jgi:hypothetical protein
MESPGRRLKIKTNIDHSFITFYYSQLAKPAQGRTETESEERLYRTVVLLPTPTPNFSGPEQLRGHRVGPILARSRGRRPAPFYYGPGRTVWADPGAGSSVLGRLRSRPQIIKCNLRVKSFSKRTLSSWLIPDKLFTSTKLFFPEILSVFLNKNCVNEIFLILYHAQI